MRFFSPVAFSFILSVFVLSTSTFGAAPVAHKPPVLPEIDIAYQKFVLPNGLTLIVHEDHKAPIVAVNVWYHVGSKNERPGKTGFAHLFEHLMFNGSENFNEDYFQALERLGATDLNGTTNEDRTNYFQNVPVPALDQVLWLESDRMGHLVGVIDKARLDEQRGVVQNEKRQYENQPYSVADELITKATFPASHPYSWTVIGSMEDLNAASLEDVKEWFATYYGAANAVIVVAGDVDAKTAKEKVEKYFGNIPSGPPVARQEAWVPKLEQPQRQSVRDRVPQARLYKIWNVPGIGTEAESYLDLAAAVLTQGKTSRLYKRLVYDDQIATAVTAYQDSKEIASQFHIEATARPGGDLKQIETTLNEELQRFLTSGPTQAELDRVKIQTFAAFVRGIERIGGFGGKSDIIAQSEVYGGSPDSYKTALERIRKATIKDVQNTANEWIGAPSFTLELTPFPEYTTAATGADRKKMPEAGEPAPPKFVSMQKATLSNGIKLIVAERHAVPVVNFSLLLDAGYASDQFATPGTASLAMGMLDEGTRSRTALQISEELADLGANLNASSNLDTSVVSLSALRSNLDPSLALYADVILNPSFPQQDFLLQQKQKLAAIQREKANPIQMALRVFPILLYGQGHAYGTSFTGSGTEKSVAALTREDLVNFHQTWFKPNNATIVVVGDATLAEIQPRLEKLFSLWKAGDVPKKNIGGVKMAESQTIYLVDKPGAIQSVIFAGHVAPPKSNPDEIAIETMNNILGGTFISRINMNLREDKHWSYGSGTFVPNARGQRPFIVYAPVQSDKTKESMIEITKELNAIVEDKPVTADELSMSKSNLILALPGSWETNNEVLASISEMVQYNLPEDYFDQYPGRVQAMTQEDMKKAASVLVHPGNLVWVVVGDREKIQKGIEELGYGKIETIDTDGNPVK